MKTKTFLFLLLLIILSGFKVTQKLTIYTIGDSTMANKDTAENNPERGWGQMLSQFFDDRVTIDNRALNGRSTKSFIDEGQWKKVLDSLKTGDYVFIQFGHNDSKPDSARHTDPRTTYRANLIRFIKETQTKGAHPVLFTSIVRRKFDSDGNLTDTHGDYLLVVRELAKEMNVPIIDLEQKTRKVVEQLGPEESKKLYMWIEPGVSERITKNPKDDTHLNISGATQVAKLAVEGIKELNLGITQYLRNNN
jgi:lysophospholipase L1-like esterase